MFYHQRDNLIIREFAGTQTKLSIDGFAGSQEIARRQLHLAEQLGKLLPCKWFDVVVHLFKRYATLPEQLVHFATLRSSRFLVNGDLVAHSFLVLVFGLRT